MDVNLPYLGSSEASGPSVENISISGNVGILAAVVPVNASVRPIEAIATADFIVGADTTEFHVDIDMKQTGNILQKSGTINMSGDVIQDSSTGAILTGEATELVEEPTNAPVLSTTIHEVSVDVNVALHGEAKEQVAGSVIDVSLVNKTEVHYYDISYNLLNLFAISQRIPFFAGKIVARSSHFDDFNMTAETTETGDVILNGSVIESNEHESVEINVPVTSIAHGLLDNFTMSGSSTILDYVAISPVSAFAVSLSIPISMSGKAESGSQPQFSVDAAINSVDVRLTAEVYDQDAVRYEIADIDQGVADGKIKIFPNEWTLCFANKPVNEDGTLATATSFLINELVAKYGSDLHTKISMIVAKHPETGAEYNFVVQDGYITPEGSMNDFPMCYLRDGAYYPVPFMVQSVSDETLELDWAV